MTIKLLSKATGLAAHAVSGGIGAASGAASSAVGLAKGAGLAVVGRLARPGADQPAADASGDEPDPGPAADSASAPVTESPSASEVPEGPDVSEGSDVPEGDEAREGSVETPEDEAAEAATTPENTELSEEVLDDADTADAPSDAGDTPSSTDDAPSSTGAVADSGIDLLPYPHLEEPVPIVEEVLAAEDEGVTPLQGHATEPHASTRDEGHGGEGIRREELEEIAEEAVEAFPGGDLDLETPVGTTGADVARNPDTAEADMQQPGTEPIVDPGTTKAVKKAATRGRSAAEGPAERS